MADTVERPMPAIGFCNGTTRCPPLEFLNEAFEMVNSRYLAPLITVIVLVATACSGASKAAQFPVILKALGM